MAISDLLLKPTQRRTKGDIPVPWLLGAAESVPSNPFSTSLFICNICIVYSNQQWMIVLVSSLGIIIHLVQGEGGDLWRHIALSAVK